MVDVSFSPQLRRAVRLVAFAAATISFAAPVRAACDATPFDGVRRTVVGDRIWVNRVSMSISELPSLDGPEARDRFVDYWRRVNAQARTKTEGGVEVTSVLKGSCLYSLQVQSGGGGSSPIYAVSDLRRPVPTLPRDFEWPPAAEGDVLTDTVSDDAGNLSRLLSYRVEKSSKAAAGQCIRRLKQADWQLDGLTQINDQHYVFHGRKRRLSVDITVARDGLGSVVTMNFAQTDG